MKGLELAKKYYEECGAPMLHEQFPEWEGVIAVGLVGAGSECFGFDDEISVDHDFEPGFCLFLPGEDVIDSKAEFQLERAYAKLPSEFCGFKRAKIAPVGGKRHGVIRAAEFYRSKIGRPTAFTALADWFGIDDLYLAEATNGEIFRDDEGSFSAVRNALLTMPADVKAKKLAGHLLLMAQSGQYNFSRCIAHGETGAAQLAAGEFCNHAMAAAFLLNGRYMPFYKWRFRALRELSVLSETEPMFETLLTMSNEPANVPFKQDLIEEIAGLFIDELKTQGLTDAVCGDLEKHAYSVNDHVKDGAIRNANILFGV